MSPNALEIQYSENAQIVKKICRDGYFPIAGRKNDLIESL